MSKPTNPMAIGAFVLGAVALLALGLLIFGGGKLLKQDTVKYVAFFDSSLNGLDVGAPVKMQGVKIGTVQEIALQLEPSTGKIFKPVVIEIDRSALFGPGGKALPEVGSEKQQKENRDRLVAAGFRARLEMQSLLTGLLYVDLDVHPGKPPQYAGLDYKGLLEIPTIPTTAEEIRSTVDQLAEQIRQLPLKEMMTDISETLKQIRNLIGSDEVRRSRDALAAALEQTRELTAQINRNLEPLLKSANRTIDRADVLIQDSQVLVRQVRGDMKPLLAAADALVKSTEGTLGTVEDAMGPDSTLQETLLTLRDAARSLRDLAEYLERHPEAVLTGKK